MRTLLEIIFLCGIIRHGKIHFLLKYKCDTTNRLVEYMITKTTLFQTTSHSFHKKVNSAVFITSVFSNLICDSLCGDIII